MTHNTDNNMHLSLAGLDKGHHLVTYRGVQCTKCPFDYVIYQMILSEVQPDLIIEIGANRGGSALYLADLMEIMGKGVVHTIDIEDRIEPLVRANKRISCFADGWDRYDLNLAKGYERILVIEDSSHTYGNTLAAINRFAPLVTPGSYLIVEDGIVDELGVSAQFDGGPVRAVKEFMTRHPEFTLERRWLDFFGTNTTFNTMGYLKRTS